MDLQRLSLETMKNLDAGKAMEAFQIGIERATQDCVDRPGDKRSRKVILQFTLDPVQVVNGNTIDCESVKGAFQCRTKIPDWETQEVDFGVQQTREENGARHAHLVFNPDSPRDYRQRTMLPNEDGEPGRRDYVRPVE